MTEHVAVDEEYLLVEEVADRLGLPLPVLMRRVEAGDIPARRIENENGVHYSLRLSDLGIEGVAPETGESSPYGAVEPAQEAHDQQEVATVDLTGHRVADDVAEDHREPAQPSPPWFHEDDEDHRLTDLQDDDAVARDAVAAELEMELAHAPVPAPDPEVTEEAPASDEEPPLPAAIIAEQRSPHGDLSSMSLDARELVAGLLDRWERTLEQRIYTEQRQRFQGELSARQNMVKQLQMELHTARAEHAAAQAEKDRQLAEKERELADRERDLADALRLADETERLLAPAARRRRWFWQHD